MRTTRFSLTLTAALAAALLLAGCAPGTSPEPAGTAPADSATTTANRADIRFAQMMIPHHEQAIEMSEDLLAKTGGDAEVRDLATAIIAAQQPEIDQFRSWLEEWGVDEGMGGMNNDTDGMMSDDDMSMLEDAADTDADRLFLQQMIMHHEGAITMATTEVSAGTDPDVVALAERIVTSQSEEIDRMRAMLERL